MKFGQFCEILQIMCVNIVEFFDLFFQHTLHKSIKTTSINFFNFSNELEIKLSRNKFY